MAINGQDFEQTSGDGEGQGSLMCCHSWGHKESDKADALNNSYILQTRQSRRNC